MFLFFESFQPQIVLILFLFYMRTIWDYYWDGTFACTTKDDFDRGQVILS